MINENEILNLIYNFKPYDNAKTNSIVLEYAKLKNNSQNFKKDKTVYVLVGPSGSGKSTFIANMYSANIFGNAENSFVPFVNRHYANTPMTLTEEIAFKTKLLEEGVSFMIESANFDENYSHFIKMMKLKYDYDICLLYLTKWSPKENLSMVLKRKKQGGHATKNVELNEKELERMYKVDSKNLVNILPYCDSCFVLNNTTKVDQSDLEKPIILLHKSMDGSIVYDKDFRNLNFLYNKILKSKKPVVQSPEQLRMSITSVDDGKTLIVGLPKTQIYRETPIMEKIDKIIDSIKSVSILEEQQKFKEKELCAMVNVKDLDELSKK